MTICGAALDCSDIYYDSQKIMQAFFSDYTMERLIEKGSYLGTIPVTGGEADGYKVSAPADIYFR